VERAAARYSLRASALTAGLGVLLCFSAPAALAAPGPDPAPHQGGGPQPDPSGGRAALIAPAPVSRPVVRSAPGPVAVKPRTVRHRRHAVRPAPPAVPHSAPSRVFNSLAAGLRLPAATSGSSGIDRDRLVLAAGALLLVILLGGSLLLMAAGETRTLRGP